MSEQNKEEILEIDQEQLQELLGGSEGTNTLPPIELDLSEYDLEEFKNGIKEYSYLAGVITALLNTGVSEGFVLDYLLNQETIRHNIQTAEINKSMNVEISKNHKAVADKYEL